jgi:hypothetical protein
MHRIARINPVAARPEHVLIKPFAMETLASRIKSIIFAENP